MNPLFYRVREFSRYYASAKTAYQLHSPFVFDLVNAILEDDRYFYAFRDIEKVRQTMLNSDTEIEITDFGAGSDGVIGHAPGVRARTFTAPLKQIARKAGSSPAQCQRLFRLAQHLQPKTMLELGSSVGIGSMYLAAGARNARFLTLEGSDRCADVAALNLNILGLQNTTVIKGAFENSLRPSLERLQKVDLAFFDGNHRRDPTLRYFEMSLDYAHEGTCFAFDDIYWSEGMTEAWQVIKQHPRVTLTIDFFDIALAFFSPDFKEKQHFQVVPKRWKPWKVF